MRKITGFAAITVAIAAALAIAASGAQAGRLKICAENLDPEDYEAVFDSGPITIPSGTVFEFAGHIFGTDQDPKDVAHESPNGPGWLVSSEENKRRADIISQDLIDPPGGVPAVITEAATSLTKKHPCSIVSVNSVVSDDWKWEQTNIEADPGLWYQAYGVLSGSDLDTSFGDDKNPFDFAAARGEIVGILTESAGSPYTIPPSD